MMIAPVEHEAPGLADGVEAQDLLQVPDGEDPDEGQRDAARPPIRLVPPITTIEIALSS